MEERNLTGSSCTVFRARLKKSTMKCSTRTNRWSFLKLKTESGQSWRSSSRTLDGGKRRDARPIAITAAKLNKLGQHAQLCGLYDYNDSRYTRIVQHALYAQDCYLACAHWTCTMHEQSVSRFPCLCTLLLFRGYHTLDMILPARVFGMSASRASN